MNNDELMLYALNSTCFLSNIFEKYDKKDKITEELLQIKNFNVYLYNLKKIFIKLNLLNDYLSIEKIIKNIDMYKSDFLDEIDIKLSNLYDNDDNESLNFIINFFDLSLLK